MQALLNERIIRNRRAPIEPNPAETDKNESDFIEIKEENVDRLDFKQFLSEFEPIVSVLVYSKDGLKAALDAGADRIYIGGEVFIDPLTQIEYGVSVQKLIEIAMDSDASIRSKLYYKTPQITKEKEFIALREDLEALLQSGIQNILVSNAGVYEFLISTPAFSNKWNMALGESFNIFNSAAVLNFTERDWFSKPDSNSSPESTTPVPASSVSSILLSSELSVSEIEVFVQNLMRQKKMIFPAECLIHGRQKLMVTEHPLLQTLCASGCAFGVTFRRTTRFTRSLPFPTDREQRTVPDSFGFFDYSLRDMKNYEIRPFMRI